MCGEDEVVEAVAKRLIPHISATTEELRWEQARFVARDVVRRKAVPEMHAAGKSPDEFDYRALLPMLVRDMV